MSMTVKDILGVLPSLSSDELERVRKHCLLLIQTGNKTAPVKVQTLEKKDWILEGIKIETRRLGLGDPLISQIRNARSFHGYEKKSQNVRDYLEQFTDSFSYIEVMKFGEVCAEELARYLRTWDNTNKYPLCFETMMRFVHHIPPALEASFPGYLMSGMIRVVVTGKFPE